MNRTRLVLCLSLLSACQPLMPMGEPDGGPRDAPTADSAIPPSSGPFTHTIVGGGVVETLVDATSDTAYAYLDLETGLAATPADPFDSDAWDVAFRRYYVITNGGVSGTGGCAAARLTTAFDAITEPPETGYVPDALDIEEDEDTSTDSAFNGGVDAVNDWYDYDPATHRLSPRDVTFVVRTVEGHFFKIQMLGYYDGAGTPGMVRFRWARIADALVVLPDAGPPVMLDGGMDAETDGGMVPPGAIRVDASSRTDWTYLRVGAGVVTPVDPATSTAWDLALLRTAIRTNSGSSGQGLGGALRLGDVPFADVMSTDTIGFTEDALSPPAMPGGEETSGSPVLSDWFDYDVATHTVSPRAETFALRRADGTYAKLRIFSWVDGTFVLQLEAIDAAPEEHVIEVDASASGAWAYVDLSAMAPVTPLDAATEATWDLGLSRTNARTSSAPSGPGEGGALDLLTTDAIASLPTEGYTEDTMVPLPGPPGSGTFDGNAVLSAWYDYDPLTHLVSPRPTSFAVRLRDGSLGRLVVSGWASGVWTLRFTYAGPGRTTL